MELELVQELCHSFEVAPAAHAIVSWDAERILMSLARKCGKAKRRTTCAQVVSHGDDAWAAWIRTLTRLTLRASSSTETEQKKAKGGALMRDGANASRA